MTSRLRMIYFLTPAIVAVFVVLYEIVGLVQPTVLPAPQTEFWLTTVVTLLTLALVPLSLKLLHFESVRKRICVGGDNSGCDAAGHKETGGEVSGEGHEPYFRWAVLRWALLSTAVLTNTVVYYLFSTSTTCGYLTLLCLVSYLFIWPSQSRMTEECQP